MSQLVHAFIEHRLTPENILRLPEYLLNSTNSTLSGKWHWTAPNIDTKVLYDLWEHKADYFINNSWSEKDLAWLKKENLTLHFLTPHLVTFDNLLRWDVYHRNEQLSKEFNILAKLMSSLLNAVDVILVPDLSSVDFFNEEEYHSVDKYRKRANGNNSYIMELSKI